MAGARLTFAAYAGSLRRGSYNKMLLAELVKAAPSDIAVNVLDIADLPLFNMDLERTPPASVSRLRQAIRAADALIIVSPEHNGSVPAVTKNIIEWASRPPEDSVLEGKPAAILGASTSYFGTVRAQLLIRQIGSIETIYFMLEPQIHVARAQEKFNERGELVDASLKKQLNEFLVSLARWTKTIAGGTVNA